MGEGQGQKQIRRLMFFAPVLLVLTAVMVIVTAGHGCAQGISPDQIASALSQSAANGASPQSLWNMGYMYFNQYPPTRDLAMQIYQGYTSAKGQTPEQSKALQQAAEFWRKKYQYWGRCQPAGTQSPSEPQKMHYPDDPWKSTMKLKAPESGGPPIQPYHPQGFKNRDYQ